MTGKAISFNDGDIYERTMGAWSKLAGDVFLDWLAPPEGQKWIDIGCGSGAFTELLVERCAPAEVKAIDPSEEQLAFARQRPGMRSAEFLNGDAMALPFSSDRFDAAVMALVIFFVPEPIKGVAEMARVVRPGGTVAAYAWDILGGGFPFVPVQTELRVAGIEPPSAPNAGVARMEALHDLWSVVGLESIQTREITVQRKFNDFEDYWSKTAGSVNLRGIVSQMAPAEVDKLKAQVCARLPSDAEGRIVYSARANAIRGLVPDRQ